jgi:hypothetical protein
MKKLTFFALVLMLSTQASLACSPIGWRLVDQKSMSVTERLCVYEKSGVQVSIIVGGFCPFHPC